jgi:hypothetical protein
METFTNVVPIGLLGTAIAVALWAWHEIRDLTLGRNDLRTHRRRDLQSDLTSAHHGVLADQRADQAL